MQKAPAIAASPETRLLPLTKLRVDERNVRSASSDPARVQADAELAASIKTHDLLEIWSSCGAARPSIGSPRARGACAR